MADIDDLQDPYDFDSLTAQALPEKSGTDPDSYYYRPSTGLNDWTAQMSRLSQGNNKSNTNGPVNGEDPQLVSLSAQDGGGTGNSSANIQALHDFYTAQQQTEAQFGQNQALALDTVPGNGNVMDFTVRQPLQLRQNAPGNQDENSSFGLQYLTYPKGLSLAARQNPAPKQFSQLQIENNGGIKSSGANKDDLPQQWASPISSLNHYPLDAKTLDISNGLKNAPRAIPILDHHPNDPDYKYTWLSLSGNAVPYSTWGFEAGMDVDADGTGHTYGPNNSGLELNKNGKDGDKWVGVVTDKKGNPIVQQSGPNKGMYISTTSLQDTAKTKTDQTRYVDSSNVNYFVLPGGTPLGQELSNAHGAKPGDFGVVIYKGIVVPAIYGDTGPAKKLGEASMSVANNFHVSANPRNGGIDSNDVKYIVFPGSGVGWPLTNEQIKERALKLFKDWGGLARAGFINKNSK